MHPFIKYLRKYPSLRFLFPLILGICCTEFLTVDISDKFSFYTFIAGVIVLIVLLLSYCKLEYKFRWIFGAAILLFFFLLGVGLTSSFLENVHYAWSDKKEIYEVVIKGELQEKDKTYLYPVEVINYIDSGYQRRTVSRNILLYVSKDSLSKTLKYGDLLLLNTKITPPRNYGNPEVFDYARYLTRKGVSGTSYVSSGNWKIVGQIDSKGIKQLALVLRSQLLVYYEKWGLKDDNLSVLSALTLGYKEDLSEEIKTSYSVAGISHVLALSGLHIGILAFILGFIFRKFERNPSIRILRFLLIGGCLWSFAFITGLSPSVVRAVIMFSALLLSQLLGRKPITLNTLGFTALLMLIYYPYYIFDVGFQLSFIAVAAIVIIQPWLIRKVKIQNRLVKYCWELIAVSLAAQLGTVPLILYYFSGFPVYFLLANLILTPLVGIILCVTMIVWVLFLFPAIQSFFLVILKFLLTILNSGVSFIEKLPFAYIDHINFDLFDVYAFYLVLLICVMYPFLKLKKVLFSTLFVLLLWVIVDTFKGI